MYIARRSIHPDFRPLGRFAPGAFNSGLRPETHFALGQLWRGRLITGASCAAASRLLADRL